jgi:hypothetical protein
LVRTNLDNLITMRVKVPSRRCDGDSITPTVESSNLNCPLKRGEKEVTGSLSWNPFEQEPMSNASEDVFELPLSATSEIRLIKTLEPKGKG